MEGGLINDDNFYSTSVICNGCCFEGKIVVEKNLLVKDKVCPKCGEFKLILNRDDF